MADPVTITPKVLAMPFAGLTKAPQSQAEPTWFPPPEAEDIGDMTDREILARLSWMLRRRGLSVSGRGIAWSMVGALFGHGSGFSTQLCRRLGIDPFAEWSWRLRNYKGRPRP